MADNNGVAEQDNEELNTDLDEELQDGVTPPGNEDEGEGEQKQDDPENDEVVVTMGEEAPPHDEDEFEGRPAEPWVKEVRKKNRELARENRELKAQKAAMAAPQEQVSQLGPEPTLEDVDYDADAFKAKYKTWLADKTAADNRAAKQKQEVEEQQAAYQARLDSYGTAKAALKVPDYDDAEDVVTQTLSTTQQGIIVSGADNAATVIYYLGKNPDKAKELASIKDPVKYAFAVAKLETQLKVTPRKAPPAPEKVVRGNSTAVGVNDPKLERLEEAADKSGDRSALVAYKKAMKSK